MCNEDFTPAIIDRRIRVLDEYFGNSVFKNAVGRIISYDRDDPEGSTGITVKFNTADVPRFHSWHTGTGINDHRIGHQSDSLDCYNGSALDVVLMDDAFESISDESIESMF